jgi:hypothetical protein
MLTSVRFLNPEFPKAFVGMTSIRDVSFLKLGSLIRVLAAKPTVYDITDAKKQASKQLE